jgi:hypothetical protein
VVRFDSKSQFRGPGARTSPAKTPATCTTFVSGLDHSVHKICLPGPRSRPKIRLSPTPFKHLRSHIGLSISQASNTVLLNRAMRGSRESPRIAQQPGSANTAEIKLVESRCDSVLNAPNKSSQGLPFLAPLSNNRRSEWSFAGTPTQ